MTKILHLEISCCDDCPYCQYNPHYTRWRDSGMDCTEMGKRIVNAGSYEDNQIHMRKVISVGIPEWCPLSNKGEK